MIVFDVINKDHEVIRQILSDLEQAVHSTPQRRRELVQSLFGEFIPHIRAEEKVLYETLKEIAGTEDLAFAAHAEHASIETALRELRQMRPSDEHWLTQHSILKAQVENHLEKEESELLEAAREVLAPEEAEAMAPAFIALKEEIRQGSLLQNAMDMLERYMPNQIADRIADRFAALSRRL